MILIKYIKPPFQGILGNLILGNDVLTDWSVYPLDIDTAVANGWLQAAHSGSAMEAGDGPIIYSGTLKSTGLAWDTFVKLYGWTKVRRIFCIFVTLSNYMAVLCISVVLGSGVGKWGEPGTVLAPEGPPTDAVCPRTLS